ncbi:Tetraspanin-like protein 8 [Sarcoptes scabiei]|uniref:Tetraspanin-like protein 8 n=1 Tax=Sarcoptes scabiei TaxID=52283 RepID=A0A132AJ95_SARSC|nr:Tetraspanin-like protein 8 [Sarcoptes scabiei]
MKIFCPSNMAFIVRIFFYGSALGIALMGVCIWIRSDSALWAYADNMDIFRYYQASYICLAVSGLILVMGIVGCMGAARENHSASFQRF